MTRPTHPKSKGAAAKQPQKTVQDKQLYDVSFYHDWCKSCGICIAFCPRKIILADKTGKPFINEPEKCIGCRFCEIHCPDFAITIAEQSPKRRKNDV